MSVSSIMLMPLAMMLLTLVHIVSLIIPVPMSVLTFGLIAGF